MLDTLPVRWVVVGVFSLSALLLAGLAVVVYRYREARGTRAFVVLLAVTAVWSASAAVKLFAPASIEQTLVAMELLYGVSFALTFFYFAAEYTGQTIHRRPIVLGGIGLYIGVVGVLTLTNPAHGLLWQGIELIPDVFPHFAHEGIGPAYWLLVLVSYSWFALGIYYLLDLHLRSRYNTTSLLLVIAGGLMPILVNLGSIFDLAPIPGLDYTPFGLAVMGMTFTTAIHQDLFAIIPIARATAIEYSSEGMVIVDADRRIRDYNRTAERFLPEVATHTGDEITTVLSEDAVGFSRTDLQSTELDLPGADRTVAITTAPIDDGAHHLGWTMVLSDITDIKRRERHLELVARVLRHNMSNEITVIQGQTEILRVHTDEEGEQHLDTIVESGRRIIDTSAKLRTIQDIVTDDRGREATALDTCIEMVVQRVRGRHPEAAIEYDRTDVWVECTIGLVPSLENLVDNAIEHNDGDDPRVEISVDVDAEDVRITIADNGPGIPTSEQRILETGETPLQHSSGVGLWLVYRFVERSGRNLTFTRSEWGGSAVGFTLDRGQPPADD